MLLIDDAGVLIQLLRGKQQGKSHAESLQSFYAPQAHRYDDFRERLLHGRGDLVELLDPWPDDRIVELGAGTGRNIGFFDKRLKRLDLLTLVDLCPALLDVARERARGLWNVQVVEGDATSWRPSRPADTVYFSYSLTMIPDWQAALDNAVSMLRPGGKIGVVDFHLPARYPALGRAFWRRWFGHDGVNLSDAHLPALQARLETVALIERTAPVPYLPGLRVPYYLYVGRKP